MTWAKVDDGLYDDPRFEAAGLEAMGLWVAALSYCARYLTDGVIDDARVKKLAGRRAPALTERLISAGWWRREGGGKLRLISWDMYLLSREDVETERVRKSEAGRRGAERTNAKRLNFGSAGAAADAAGSSGASRARDPDPVPSRPVPEEREQALSPAGAEGFKLEPPEPKPRKDRKRPETPLPDAWKPNASHFKTGGECGLDDNRVLFEAERFRDHARANDRRCVLWDAAFANWLRGAKPGPAPATFRPVQPVVRQGPPQPPRFGHNFDAVGRRFQDEALPPKREPEPPPTPEELAEVEELNRQRFERVARERREAAKAAS